MTIRDTSLEGGYIHDVFPEATDVTLSPGFTASNGLPASGDTIEEAIEKLSGVAASWTPVPTGLTVVGTPTYEGRYYDHGKIRFFTMKISSDTTTESTAGTTYFTGMPAAATLSASNCTAANSDDTASYGVGRVIDIGGGNMRVMVPTWAATASVTISGFILLL